jgi:NAD(P)-dependent dehydrogenase (short-subunit alcohol dehydrogenase family)
MTDGGRRTVLITGAGRRIGRAIALNLARHGWDVGVHHHASAADAEAVVAEIRAVGGRAAAFAADLADEDETVTLVDRVRRALGPLSALVNNASIFEDDRPMTATRESWDRHLQVNLRAPFVLIQEFVRQLSADRGGSVVNILDQRVWRLTPYFTTYTLSKAGLWTLTQTLAMALAPRVRVNAVGPGPTLPSPRQTREQFDRQWSAVPLQRPVDPSEIADAVRFLLDAASLTGQMIAVDAGQHLGWPPPGAETTAEE